MSRAVVFPSKSQQTLSLYILLLISSVSVSAATIQPKHYAGTRLSLKSLGLKQEKLTHFRLYWHDVLSGPKPTSIQVLNATSASTGFGAMNMIDDPLTQGPGNDSTLIGRAQGFYALSSQEETGLLMSMNFVFLQGKYNGSTIMVLGRDVVSDKVREMPVVGGTGLFRFARGYVEARTITFDTKTLDATVQYDCYVLHY